MWFLDRLGGPKFIETGLDGPIEEGVGADSIIIQCQDCSHCQDLSKPKKEDSKELREGRDKIAFWIEDFVKKDGHLTNLNTIYQ